MAWTAPMTAVANSTFTDVDYNRQIRDNFLCQAPANSTTAGSYFIVTGTNQVSERNFSVTTVATSQSRTNTAYGDLATVGPTVTVTVKTAALVWFMAQISNNTSNSVSRASIAMSGANQGDPSDRFDIHTDGRPANEPTRFMSCHLFKNLKPGSTTFKMRYRCSNTATYSNRTLMVMPL